MAKSTYRMATFQENMKIYETLKERLVKTSETNAKGENLWQWLNKGDNDTSISKELGVPYASVVRIRREMFGLVKRPKSINTPQKKLAARIDYLEKIVGVMAYELEMIRFDTKTELTKQFEQAYYDDGGKTNDRL